METKELHFTLGEDAGKILTDIARDHLLCSYDPQKALNTIMQSLIGCPKQLALDIIIGDYVILMNKEGTEFVCTKFDKELHSKIFSQLDLSDWSAKKFLKIQDTALDFLEFLDRIREEVFANNGRFSVDIEYSKVIQYFYDKNSADCDLLDDNEGMLQVSSGILAVKKFIEESLGIIRVIRWMHSNCPTKVYEGFTHMPKEVTMLSAELANLVNGNAEVDLQISKQKEAYSKLDQYIKGELSAQETLKSRISPVNILDNWSAGWLSPNGEYYALNGEIANMLHNKIADALLESGIIEIKDHIPNPDSWLEENGWVKIHEDWILYDGWNRGRLLNGRPVPMTETQRDVISKYGQVCCKGVLKLGFKREHLSAARFGMTDIPMLKKYFDF